MNDDANDDVAPDEADGDGDTRDEETGDGDTGDGQTEGGATVLARFGGPHGLLLLVGLLLWAGALSISIEGLGLTVGVPGGTSIRIGAVVLGAFALGSSFLLWPALDRRRSTILSGASIVFGGLLLGLVAQADPRVPDVRGLSEENAVNILRQLGISASPIPVAEPDADPQRNGSVIGQSPAGGSRSATVTLQVAALPAPRLPDVRQRLDAGEARQLLEELGVDVDVELVDGTPAGAVTGMLPAPPTRSFTVQLFVASGVAAPAMIDADGLTAEAASERLAERGITVTVVERESSEPVGTVIGQEPAPGEPTSTATIVVSAGPGAPVIADVVNETSSAAVEQLEADGITVTVERRPSDEVPADIVLAVEPEPGERSTAATIVVSDGPTVSSFVGEWTNVDPAAEGVVRFVISEGSGSGDELTIQAFAACTPDPCDWGRSAGTVDQGRLTGRFDLDVKVVDVSLERAGPLLAATVVHDYVDERADRVVTHTFSLAPVGAITAEELEVIANAEVLDVVLASGAAAEVPQLAPVALPELAPARLVDSPGG